MKKFIQLISIVSSILVCSSVFANSATDASSKETSAVAKEQAAPISKININTADANTLAKELNGVGEAKAKAIVEYRDQNGPFKTVEDLANVSGIGAATIEKNKNKMVVQ